MEVKINYKQTSNFEFTQVMQKLANQPVDHDTANHIRHVVNELQTGIERISKEYMSDVVEQYALKDAEGKLVRPEGQPQGFEPDPAKADEFLKAQEAFGERELIIKWRPLTRQTLKDIKLTAKELNLLGPLYTEEEGPGLTPEMHAAMGNLRSIAPQVTQ